MRIVFRFSMLLLAMTLGQPSMAKEAGGYATEGECDGFPKIHLKAAPGMCVGLVASKLGFVRGVAAIGSDVYVVDMGGWQHNHGRLLRLRDHGRGAPELLIDHLDEPHSLLVTPDNKLYLGMLGKVMRVDPGTLKTQDIVVNLPTEGHHSLPALALAPDGWLFVNIGTASDHCENSDDSPPDPSVPCPESKGSPPRGTIIHVMPGATPVDARTVKPYATGLRNSMALVALPSGKLYAAVNARDAINQADPSLSDEELPHDTFDVVEPGRDYGWPYCFDNRRPNPEYKHYDCSHKQLPTLLLPAHAAPLGMLAYKGHLFESLHGKLVIGYHGYRKQGHRVVALGLDSNGMPASAPEEIITGWDTLPGDHPQGAPVSLLELDDGSILVTEDQNGTLLRVARDR